MDFLNSLKNLITQLRQAVKLEPLEQPIKLYGVAEAYNASLIEKCSLYSICKANLYRLMKGLCECLPEAKQQAVLAMARSN